MGRCFGLRRPIYSNHSSHLAAYHRLILLALSSVSIRVKFAGESGS
jgi:hypothetical protein